MLTPIVIGTIMYASMLVLLCIGFTFTHMIEKFPNFAHTSYASIGTLFAYNFVRLWGYNPYAAWPFAALLGGFFGVALYVLIVLPMQKIGTSGIHITFAMFALTYVINAVLAVFSYWVMIKYGFRTGRFMLKTYDFTFNGLPGILFMAPVTSIALVTLLHLFLTRSKFGVAIRATIEDPELASGLGVNTFRVHIASWFLTGAIAGLAGAALPLWQPTSLSGSDQLMMSVIAGSVLGGLDNIYGAIVGGVAFAYAQRILPGVLIRAFGIWIAGYEPLVPVLVITIVLWLEPRGITGTIDGSAGRAGRLGRAIRRLLGS
ncbi:MAG: branched-chain amino acid ABC transporter permease [Candidatus Bathyarchaeia archaeon]